jgi:hypothetical protein
MLVVEYPCLAMYPCGHPEIGYVLWAIAQNFVEHYGPESKIVLCVKGHSIENDLALWTIVQNFIKRNGPRCRIIDQSAK